MNILQTFYCNKSLKDLLRVQMGYIYPEIFGLSIAYSCLLIKSNHQNDLILYGNETFLDFLINKMKLPYLNGIELKNENKNLSLYAWPKIETYKLQHDPFIHIDLDVFINKPLPKNLFRAKLLAQHEEHDNTFYRRVFNNAIDSGIILPDVVNKHVITSDAIASYNAGLLGGRNTFFIKEYVKQVENFIDINRRKIEIMPKPYLLNVIFEQWIFYAMAKEQQIKVDTYYHDVVKDFKMPIEESENAMNLFTFEYLHLMNKKSDPICNKMIVNNMRKEFPEYYHRIISLYKKEGVGISLYNFTNCIKNNKQSDSNVKVDFCRTIAFLRDFNFIPQTNDEITTNKFNELINEIGNLNHGDNISDILEVYCYELEKQKLLRKSINNLMKYKLLLENLTIKFERLSLNKNIEEISIEINPYIHICCFNERILKKFFSKDIHKNDRLFIWVFDYVLGRVNEIILGVTEIQLFHLIYRFKTIPNIVDEINRMNNISEEKKQQKINNLNLFIKFGYYNGLLC